MGMRSVCCFAVMALAMAANVFADPIDDIEADVSAKWDKIQSMSYDMDMSNKMVNDAMDYSMTSTGTTEMSKKDGKWLMRMESKGHTTQKLQGAETKQNSTTLMVSSGEFMYTLMDTDGQKMCTKTKSATTSEMAGGKGFFKYLRTSHDVKVLPEESVSGEACHVVEATPKNLPPGSPAMPMRYYFSKANGMVMRTAAKTADGKNDMNMTIKNLKLDPAIGADRFVFTPPPGVQVQDMSDMEAQMKKLQEDAQKQVEAAQKAAADAQKQAEAANKKEEPKAEEKPAAKSEPAKSEPAKEPAKAEPKKKEEKKPKIKGLGF